MAVWCYGSINADWVYAVPHLVAPGETLAATGLFRGLGGKGANQSVAAARAGAQVFHVGAVGGDGAWAVEALAGFGVDVSGVATVDVQTAHAIIQVDDAGENAIVLYSGANLCVAPFEGGQAGDWLMLQNEANGVVEAAKAARERGMKVAYSAAPFDAGAAAKVLPFVDLLLVNALENAALEAELSEINVARVVTRGADGAEWLGEVAVPALPVSEVVDTTGAGDCFAGYLVAGLDAGLARKEALQRAVVAAGLQVTKKGTADAMPLLSDVLQAVPG